ncbi:Flavodoxin [Butyrivibrio sp. ob235]|uniref:flavodoxin n=1 Tax=Butyrivibrio sp. ob235 TaxID=1761780 RepID=UPI0008CC0F64|nr:flavodoxin [Butyrivibrio sp. ob235]SEL20317.1 Flavodoxin [Butyrivibrio sp. ob235]
MSKTLVAYFSASGVTGKVAEKIAKVANADLFEIVPVTPYTSEDLDWQNSKSRSSVEMNDATCRPAISIKIGNISGYNHVFLGFPIWWYREPSIIDTFLESYDFSGIIIVPFCTSGGSNLGDTVKNLQKMAKGAMVINGKRFTPDTPEEEYKKWIDEIMA